MPSTSVIAAAATSGSSRLEGQNSDSSPDGLLWRMLPFDSNTLKFYYSTDGSSWTYASGSDVVGAYGHFVIDADGHAHLTYGAGVIYRRGVRSGNNWSWSAALTIQSSGQYRPRSIAAHKLGSEWRAHIVSGRYFSSQNDYECGHYEYDWEAQMCDGNGGYQCCTCTHHHTTKLTTTSTQNTTCPWSSWSHTHTVYDSACHPFNMSHTHSICSCSVVSSTYISKTCTSTSYHTYNYYHRVNISSGGSPTVAVSAQAIGGDYGSGSHPLAVIDFKNNGDGKTVSGNPDIFVFFTNNASTTSNVVYFRKAVYSAGSWSWNATRTIDTGHSLPYFGQSAISAVFNGTDFVMAYGNGAGFKIVTRDAADTTTTVRANIGALGSNVNNIGLAYDVGANENYVIYTLGSGALYRKYSSTWTQVVGQTSIGGANAGAGLNLDVKRHGGVSSIDGVLHNATNKDFVWVQAELLQSPPLAPSIAVTPSVGVATARVVLKGLGDPTLSWTHNDPQGDPQAHYALKVIVNGATKWWNGTGLVTTETFVASSSSQVTLPESVLSLGTIEWAVATKDAFNTEPGPYSATQTFTYRLPLEGWGEVELG